MEKNVSPDILMHVKIYGTNPHKSVPICVDGTKRLSFGIFPPVHYMPYTLFKIRTFICLRFFLED